MFDFANLPSFLHNVPFKHLKSVITIISSLEHLLGQLGPVLVFVETHLPAILSLLDSGFSVPAIIAFIANLFPAVNPPAPAPAK